MRGVLYLAGLKRVLDGAVNVDLDANDRRVSEYVATLLRSAEETDKRDAFSNAALFDEVEFSIENPYAFAIDDARVDAVIAYSV